MGPARGGCKCIAAGSLHLWPGGHPNPHAYPDADSYLNTYCQSYLCCKPHAFPNANACFYAHSDSDSDAYPYSNSYAYAYANSYPYRCANTYSYTYPYPYTNAQRGGWEVSLCPNLWYLPWSQWQGGRECWFPSPAGENKGVPPWGYQEPSCPHAPHSTLGPK